MPKKKNGTDGFMDLADLLTKNKHFLLEKIVNYSSKHGYINVISAIEKSLVQSIDQFIDDLTNSIINVLNINKEIPELRVNYDYSSDFVPIFTKIDVNNYRSRELALEMFLGLIKYCRQSYLELVSTSKINVKKKKLYLLWINRFFDHNEIAFATEWSKMPNNIVFTEMLEEILHLIGEKDRYINILENIPIPVIIIENERINMNLATINLLKGFLINTDFSESYFKNNVNNFYDIFPWIKPDFSEFYNSTDLEKSFEKEFDISSVGIRNLLIKFQRLFDVRNIPQGIVIAILDMTDKKHLEDALRYTSFHDSLTGLYNLSYFEEEIQRIGKGRLNPIGLISCDVDCLKLVNDTFGHNAGDVLIKAVSKVLKNSFRNNDVVARVGGDEFVIIMPSTTLELVNEEIMEHACQRIKEKVTLHNQEEQLVPISVSIGYSVGNINDSIHETLKNADKMMYKNKARNHEKFKKLLAERIELYGEKLYT